jgi:hypothetical protein
MTRAAQQIRQLRLIPFSVANATCQFGSPPIMLALQAPASEQRVQESGTDLSLLSETTNVPFNESLQCVQELLSGRFSTSG